MFSVIAKSFFMYVLFLHSITTVHFHLLSWARYLSSETKSHVMLQVLSMHFMSLVNSINACSNAVAV